MFWMYSSKNNVRSSFPISRKAMTLTFMDLGLSIPLFSSLATSDQSYFDRRFKVAFRQTPNQIRSSINTKGAGTIKPTVA